MAVESSVSNFFQENHFLVDWIFLFTVLSVHKMKTNINEASLEYQ